MQIPQERPADLTEVKVETDVAAKRSTLFPLFHGLEHLQRLSVSAILLILKDAPAHSPRELVLGFCWVFGSM